MNQQKSTSPRIFVFSKWSRKKYAIFASLGKLIKIGVLKIEICQKALLKGLVNLGNILEIKENPDGDGTDLNITEHDFLQFVLKSLGLSVFPTCILTSNTTSKKANPLKTISNAYTACFLLNVRNRLFFINATWISQIFTRQILTT